MTLLTDAELMAVFPEGVTAMTTIEHARAIEAAVLAKHAEGDDLSDLPDQARVIARDAVAKTKFPKPYMSAGTNGFKAHRWVIEAVMAGIAAGRNEAEAKHHLIQDTEAEAAETFSTSLIRAAMASVLEAVPTSIVIDKDDNGIVRVVSVTINLEAQRTIWDRYELSTSRTPDEHAVIFTLTRK